MENYVFFHRDGGYCRQDANPSRPETWPYAREEIANVYLNCTERFLFSENDAVQNLTPMLRLSRESKKLKDLLDYIDAHYKEKLTRNFALKKIGMSKSRFSSFFRSQTGMTYIEYINKARIEKAVPLLIETDMTVESAGFECGFDSLPIFYKCFKKQYGMSPARFKIVRQKCITGSELN